MQIFRNHWQLLLLTLIIVYFWNAPWLTPLKILVVFFHEFSHAIAAVLTGGRVAEFEINPMQGGHVIALGGSSFWLSTSGYLGSLLCGVLLFAISVNSRLDRYALAALGILMVLVTLLWIRSGFAVAFTLGTAMTLLLIARAAPHNLCDFTLRVIGMASMIYVPWDIWDDTIRRSGAMSDARILALNIGGTTLMWGIIWFLISLLIIAATFRYVLRGNSNLTLR
ncbi:M50 family metallopeptidase [Halocynthiibacter sp.]|uniref:M50 family metallopeptidase n=1 Tax=Halocynthiibacter sp. TaxID=1979210 RepID=UPI003C415C65